MDVGLLVLCSHRLLWLLPPAPSSSLDMAFYSGNDVYGFCQYDRAVAFAYIAGLYDEAAHAALVVDDFRSAFFRKKTPQNDANDAEVDFQLKRIVGYCTPRGVTVEQVADVFCKYLKDSPEKRDWLPSMLFSEALTKAWPCPDAQ
jgi:hypothetical protein